MKNTSLFSSTRRTLSGARALLLGASAAVLLAQSAHAATTYYLNSTFGGTATIIRNGTVWSTDPVSGGTTGVTPTASDTLVFNQSSVNGNETGTINNNWSAAGMIFNNTGSSTISSSSTTRYALTLGAGGVTVNSGAGAVTLGNSSNRQLDLTINASQSWTNNSSSTLTARQGTVDLKGNTLTITGAGNTAILDPIAETVAGGSLVKTGDGILTLSGASSYTGATTLTVGTLVASADKALGNTSGVTVNGGTLDIQSATAGTVTLGSAANFLLSSGSVKLQLDTVSDQLVSSGAGAFTITGGTFVLDVMGAGFSYANTYQVLSGFGGSNSVSGLSFSGYDDTNYTATLGTDGVLSFGAVPEPATYMLFGLGGLVLMLRARRIKSRS